jgi:hypothetical protein
MELCDGGMFTVSITSCDAELRYTRSRKWLVMTYAKLRTPAKSEDLKTIVQGRALSISFETLIYYHLHSLQLSLAQLSAGLKNTMVW